MTFCRTYAVFDAPLARTVEPLLLLFLGLVVAFLALSVITPIFRVTGSIGQ